MMATDRSHGINPHAEIEEASDAIARAVISVKESEQGYGEVKIVIKERKMTRIIVTLDTKVS